MEKRAIRDPITFAPPSFEELTRDPEIIALKKTAEHTAHDLRRIFLDFTRRVKNLPDIIEYEDALKKLISRDYPSPNDARRKFLEITLTTWEDSSHPGIGKIKEQFGFSDKQTMDILRPYKPNKSDTRSALFETILKNPSHFKNAQIIANVARNTDGSYKSNEEIAQVLKLEKTRVEGILAGASRRAKYLPLILAKDQEVYAMFTQNINLLTPKKRREMQKIMRLLFDDDGNIIRTWNEVEALLGDASFNPKQSFHNALTNLKLKGVRLPQELSVRGTPAGQDAFGIFGVGDVEPGMSPGFQIIQKRAGTGPHYYFPPDPEGYFPTKETIENRITTGSYFPPLSSESVVKKIPLNNLPLKELGLAERQTLLNSIALANKSIEKGRPFMKFVHAGGKVLMIAGVVATGIEIYEFPGSLSEKALVGLDTIINLPIPFTGEIIPVRNARYIQQSGIGRLIMAGRPPEEFIPVIVRYIEKAEECRRVFLSGKKCIIEIRDAMGNSTTITLNAYSIPDPQIEKERVQINSLEEPINFLPLPAFIKTPIYKFLDQQKLPPTIIRNPAINDKEEDAKLRALENYIETLKRELANALIKVE